MAPRTGVPVLMQRQFRSNVVVVFAGQTSALRGMSAFRAAFSKANPDELAVDDTVPTSPVYFFETKSDRQVSISGTEYQLILTFLGVDKDTHPSLPLLASRGHEFIYITDLPAEAAQAALADFSRRLPEEKRAMVHLLSTASSSASAVLAKVQDHIAANAAP